MALAALIVLLPQASVAHRLGESYVYFQVTDTQLTGRFEARAVELEPALGLDADGDGMVSEAELSARDSDVFAFFADRLTLSVDGKPLAITQGDATLLRTGQGHWVQMSFGVPALTDVPDRLTMRYRNLGDVLAEDRTGFALIESNTRTGVSDNESRVSLIFRDDAEQVLHLAGDPWHTTFVEFVIHGIWHIWLGLDHVVFLITLLLPSVMMARAGHWVPEERFRASIWNVLKIVTLFTVSHSITLSLAALDIVRMPPTFVEAIIAVSIAVVAVLNMFPSAHRFVLALVFFFGLFHGFGFANVLEPLGVSPSQKLIGLAGFNIGVEIGQIAIVLVCFPLLWALRTWRHYPPLAFRVGSVALVAVATLWFLERTTDFDWNAKATLRSFIEAVT